MAGHGQLYTYDHITDVEIIIASGPTDATASFGEPDLFKIGKFAWYLGGFYDPIQFLNFKSQWFKYDGHHADGFYLWLEEGCHGLLYGHTLKTTGVIVPPAPAGY